MASIIPFLSSSQGRRDENLNILLAQRIVDNNDQKGMKELIFLINQKDKKVASDAIKVLYEIGYRNPKILVKWLPDLIPFLENKNNRLQWGAMTTISTLAHDYPEKIHSFLPQILSAMENGSVISKDHGVKILASLTSINKHRSDILTLLMEFIQTAPVNQFPTYATTAAYIVKTKDENILLKEIILTRYEEFTLYPAKEKKLDKVLKSLE